MRGLRYSNRRAAGRYLREYEMIESESAEIWGNLWGIFNSKEMIAVDRKINRT